MQKHLFIFLSLLLLISFNTACDNIKPRTSTEQVLLIKDAINSNDVKSLRSLSELPLFFRNQEWELANDGYGFILGDFEQRQILNDDEFTKYFNKVIATVQIEGEEVISQDITLALFSEELKGDADYWSILKLYLLKRGEGDVEHIILLGLDKDSNKLRAIYIN